MIYIGICDDQSEIASILEQIINAIQEEWKCQWQIQTFNSGEALLENIEDIDVVFLDIEMPGMDGIETGNKIKKKNPNCKIIMATGMVDRFKDAFRIQAFRFVTKPFDKKEVEEALEAFLNVNAGVDTIELFYNRNSFVVQQREICYIQALDSYSEFMANSKIFRKEISLNDLEKELDDRLFCRIHRNCIVNFRWVDDFKDGKIYINGEVFPVSRRKKKEVERKYVEYDLKYR